MRICAKCGAEYEGGFCPTGCDSPVFQQRLEAQRLAAKRAREPGIQRWILVLIAVICVLRAAVPVAYLCAAWSLAGTQAAGGDSFGRSAGYGLFRQKSVYGMNEPAVCGNCEILVMDVTRSQGLSYDHPSEGMEYVVVTVNIRNIGTVRDNAPVVYDKKFFKIRDDTGQLSERIFSFAHKETALSHGVLEPGEQITGTLLFEQPMGAELTLCYYHLGMEPPYSAFSPMEFILQ